MCLHKCSQTVQFLSSQDTATESFSWEKSSERQWWDAFITYTHILIVGYAENSTRWSCKAQIWHRIIKTLVYIIFQYRKKPNYKPWKWDMQVICVNLLLWLKPLDFNIEMQSTTFQHSLVSSCFMNNWKKTFMLGHTTSRRQLAFLM